MSVILIAAGSGLIYWACSDSYMNRTNQGPLIFWPGLVAVLAGIFLLGKDLLG